MIYVKYDQDGEMFQYPLPGLDRLLPLQDACLRGANLRFNTLCRVLIGCYQTSTSATCMGHSVSIPSVGS